MSFPGVKALAEPTAGSRSRVVAGVVEAVCEASLVLLSAVAAATTVRLFTDDAYLVELLALTAASHLVAALLRRIGAKAVSSAALSAACFAIAATRWRYGETAWYALPTSETLSSVGADLSEAWTALDSGRAPMEPITGLVLATAAVFWAGAFISDSLAFRLGSPAGALAVASAVFIGTAALGNADGSLRHTTAFCAAAALVLTVLRLRARGASNWVEARPGQGLRAAGLSGGLSAGLAVAAGVLIAPALPGAQEPPWLDLRELEMRASTRRVLSPLVQVQSHLVSQSEQEMFTVTVPEGARQYWRLMSLDSFDGSEWSARSRFGDVSRNLPATVPEPIQGAPLRQTVTIGALGNIYLPAAYEVRRVVDDGGQTLEYEVASGALVLSDGDLSTASAVPQQAFTYTVESAGPDISGRAELEGPPALSVSEAFLAHNTSLPDDFPESVRTEAQLVTAGADSDYERALLLQDYFWLGDRFTYDTGVAAGHGADSLESFLFEVRTGYCEQFAASYAAMARSIGLPARVAVGFTWGEWDAERGAYAVRGKHAHAWPEVFLSSAGWVRFEPTPGRGGPDDFAVTGRVAAQAVDIGQPERLSGAPRSDESVGTGIRQPRQPRAVAPTTMVAVIPGSGDASDGVRVWHGALLAAGIATAAGLYALTVPTLRRLKRRRLSERAVGYPELRVRLAWDDAVASLDLLGFAPRSAETPSELARRVASTRLDVTERPAGAAATTQPEAGRKQRPTLPDGSLETLAQAAALGCFAPSGTVSADWARRAELASATIVSACRRQIPVMRRAAAALDPRPLFNGE